MSAPTQHLPECVALSEQRQVYREVFCHANWMSDVMLLIMLFMVEFCCLGR